MNYNIMPSSDKAKSGRGKYPWSELNVGQSFAVPISEVSSTTLLSLSYKTGKRLGRKFKVVEHIEAKVFEVARLPDPVEDKEKQPKAILPTLRGFQPISDNPGPVGDGSTAPVGWPLPDKTG